MRNKREREGEDENSGVNIPGPAKDQRCWRRGAEPS